VTVPAEAVDAFTGALLDLGAEGVLEDYPELHDEGPAVSATEWAPAPPVPESGDVELSGYLPPSCSEPEVLITLRARFALLGELFPALRPDRVTIENVREEDWGRAWREHFTGVDVGRALRVRPSWISPAGGDRIELVVDPSMAFGTGTHFTTAACLEAIEEAVHEGGSMLDVGTGTGVLAIAAAKLGARRIVALDVDDDAVAVAAHNVEINGVADRIALVTGTVENVDGRFDVVAANLLAPVLRSVAADLAARLVTGGLLVVSGLLVGQEAELLDVFRRQGLQRVHRRSDDEWVELGLR